MLTHLDILPLLRKASLKKSMNSIQIPQSKQLILQEGLKLQFGGMLVGYKYCRNEAAKAQGALPPRCLMPRANSQN